MKGAPLGDVLSGIGIAVEIVGIGLAGRGLYLTWKDNVPQEKQVGQLLRMFFAAVRRRLRRRTQVTAGVATAWAVAAEAHGVGTVTPSLRSLTSEMSRPELISSLTHNFEALKRITVEMQAELGAAKHENAQEARRLATELSATQAGLTEQAKTLVVEGVPMAVAGLVVTMVGLLLQGIGTFV
jgi:pyruvate/oxaloacetate carboxyltransferase